MTTLKEILDYVADDIRNSNPEDLHMLGHHLNVSVGIYPPCPDKPMIMVALTLRAVAALGVPELPVGDIDDDTWNNANNASRSNNPSTLEGSAEDAAARMLRELGLS